MTYYSTKTFEYAFSTAFRQHRADSHCRFLHGYALSVRFVFGTNELDERNWAVDFGSLKSLKSKLEDTFDHKTVVAADDPELKWFTEANSRGILELIVVDHGGMERFAELIFEATEVWLKDSGYAPRCWIDSVEVSEHSGNSAIYKRKQSCGCEANRKGMIEFRENDIGTCQACGEEQHPCNGMCIGR